MYFTAADDDGGTINPISCFCLKEWKKRKLGFVSMLLILFYYSSRIWRLLLRKAGDQGGAVLALFSWERALVSPAVVCYWARGVLLGSNPRSTMASNMTTKDFFAKGTPKQFDFALSHYDKALRLKAEAKSSKPENVIKLDKW